jgi:hypothetical protein
VPGHSLYFRLLAESLLKDGAKGHLDIVDITGHAPASAPPKPSNGELLRHLPSETSLALAAPQPEPKCTAALPKNYIRPLGALSILRCRLASSGKKIGSSPKSTEFKLSVAPPVEPVGKLLEEFPKLDRPIPSQYQEGMAQRLCQWPNAVLTHKESCWLTLSDINPLKRSLQCPTRMHSLE